MFHFASFMLPKNSMNEAPDGSSSRTVNGLIGASFPLAF